MADLDLQDEEQYRCTVCLEVLEDACDGFNTQIHFTPGPHTHEPDPELILN